MIILTDQDRRDRNDFILSDYRFEHIRDILKLSEGDSIEVGLPGRGRGTGQIKAISTTEVAIGCSRFEAEPESCPAIDLICALPRPQTVKKVLFTAGMTGVRKIHLIRSNRVEKSYFHSPLLSNNNYEKHLIEGMMQGKITRLPEVSIHDRFKVFFEDIFPGLISDKTLKLLPDAAAEAKINEVYSGEEKHLIIAIGPEGDWVQFEKDFMLNLGFKMFSLGRYVLRVEHAVTAILSQIEMLRVDNES